MSTTTQAQITKKPDIQGGDACIAGTRIPVWLLVNRRRLGMSDVEILDVTKGLTAVDLRAAFAYAAAHQEEIDLAIRENEKGDEGLVE
jgi:uncharacterized protein (DUF433 family)